MLITQICVLRRDARQIRGGGTEMGERNQSKYDFGRLRAGRRVGC